MVVATKICGRESKLVITSKRYRKIAFLYCIYTNESKKIIYDFLADFD